MTSTTRPLQAFIEGEEVVIRVGIDTMRIAFENSEENSRFDEGKREYVPVYAVSDPLLFAKDAIIEMEREGEDGSTPLTGFLDKMMAEAANQGSLGIADDEL